LKARHEPLSNKAIERVARLPEVDHAYMGPQSPSAAPAPVRSDRLS
jgi:hypothetical protein